MKKEQMQKKNIFSLQLNMRFTTVVDTFAKSHYIVSAAIQGSVLSN